MVSEPFGKKLGSGAGFWKNLQRNDDLETAERTAWPTQVSWQPSNVRLPVAIVDVAQVAEPHGCAGVHRQHSRRIRARAPRHDVAAVRRTPISSREVSAVAVEESGARGESLIECLAVTEHSTASWLGSGIPGSCEHVDNADPLKCRGDGNPSAGTRSRFGSCMKCVPKSSAYSPCASRRQGPRTDACGPTQYSPADSSGAPYCARNTLCMLTKIVDNMCALTYG